MRSNMAFLGNIPKISLASSHFIQLRLAKVAIKMPSSNTYCFPLGKIYGRYVIPYP